MTVIEEMILSEIGRILIEKKIKKKFKSYTAKRLLSNFMQTIKNYSPYIFSVWMKYTIDQENGISERHKNKRITRSTVLGSAESEDPPWSAVRYFRMDRRLAVAIPRSA